MGHAYTELTYANAAKPDVQPLMRSTLADSGATYLSIPEELGELLKLDVLEYREVEVADGRKAKVPYAGPVKITLGERSCYTGVLLMGEKPLLGVVPMEDMDIIIDPREHKVIANPDRPLMAGGLAMTNI